MLNLSRITYYERNVHRLYIRRVLRVVGSLATHGFTMVGSEDNDGILIQAQLFNAVEYLTESTVYTGNRRKVVCSRFCLLSPDFVNAPP